MSRRPFDNDTACHPSAGETLWDCTMQEMMYTIIEGSMDSAMNAYGGYENALDFLSVRLKKLHQLNHAIPLRISECVNPCQSYIDLNGCASRPGSITPHCSLAAPIVCLNMFVLQSSSTASSQREPRQFSPLMASGHYDPSQGGQGHL